MSIREHFSDAKWLYIQQDPQNLLTLSLRYGSPMPSSTFLYGTAGRPMVLFGVSIGSINLISSHNSLGILLIVGRYLTLASQAYEKNTLKLYVYLSLGLGSK